MSDRVDYAKLEEKLRSRAKRLGLKLQKNPGRRRGRPGDDGFRLLDRRTNVVVAGAHPWDYSLDLEDVADELDVRARRIDIRS